MADVAHSLEPQLAGSGSRFGAHPPVGPVRRTLSLDIRAIGRQAGGRHAGNRPELRRAPTLPTAPATPVWPLSSCTSTAMVVEDVDPAALAAVVEAGVMARQLLVLDLR